VQVTTTRAFGRTAACAALRPVFVARRWVDFQRVDSALCR
jgi:hypothetical protein